VCVTSPQSPDAGRLFTCRDALENTTRLLAVGAPELGTPTHLEMLEADCAAYPPPQDVLACRAGAATKEELRACPPPPPLPKERLPDPRAVTQAERERRTIEAVRNVYRIHEGARLYYEESAASVREFPASAPQVTPRPGSCCGSLGGRCDPDPALWDQPTWQALRFSVDEPHFYSYSYVSSGAGAKAQFSAAAYGDLDCDGEYSTFEMIGSIAHDGTVIGAVGFFRDNELE
jgi:hypothetical protein